MTVPSRIHAASQWPRKMGIRLFWNVALPETDSDPEKPRSRDSFFRLCEQCGSQIVDCTRTRFCCDACRAAHWKRICTTEREAKGIRPIRSWNAIRWEILERDNFSCRKCGGRFLLSHLEIHHIIPVSEGGDSRPENLITECEECHKKERSRSARAKRQHIPLNTFFEIPA